MEVTFKISKKPDVSFTFSNFTSYLILFHPWFILVVGLEDSNSECKYSVANKNIREEKVYSRSKKRLVFDWSLDLNSFSINYLWHPGTFPSIFELQLLSSAGFPQKAEFGQRLLCKYFGKWPREKIRNQKKYNRKREKAITRGILELATTVGSWVQQYRDLLGSILSAQGT